MGGQFTMELYETFYSRASFEVLQAYDMNALLYSGVFFHCPIIAPLNFVRRLEVILSIYLHPCEKDYRLKEGARFKVCAGKEDFVRQVEYLSGLTQIEYATRLNLHIRVNVYRLHDFAKFEEALMPLIYELKGNGVKVTPTRTVGGISGSVDFTSSYDVPSKDWDEKIRKKSAFVSTTLQNIETAF
jgi:hypothetical protein